MINKYETCQGCTDRCIEPVNCHTTCEGYLERKRKKESTRQRRAIDKDFYNFKKDAVRETLSWVRK